METVLIVALGAAIAGLVQGISGFAFGVVSMSIWVWVLDPHLAASLVVFGALSGQIVSIFTARRGFRFQLLWPFIAGGLLGLPVGVGILPLIDSNWFKTLLGIFLLTWCPVMLFARNLPRIHAPSRWQNGAIGFISGIMTGLGGFSGVLPSLWCMLCNMDKDVQRNIVQNFSLTMLSVAMVTYVVSGLITSAMLPLFAVVLPAMLIPTWVGMRLYPRIPHQAFQRLVLTLLTFSGISMLITSLPHIL